MEKSTTQSNNQIEIKIGMKVKVVQKQDQRP